MSDMPLVNRIGALRTRMRWALMKADQYDKEWNRLNDAFKAKHREENERRAQLGREPKSPIMMAADKNASLAMSDAFGAQKWWREQAAMLAQVIQAELAVVEVLGK